MLQNLPSVLFLQRRRHSAVEKGARPTPADVVFGRRLLSFPRSSVGGVGWPIAHRGEVVVHTVEDELAFTSNEDPMFGSHRAVPWTP
ncbi:hypothetical protein Y032_1044g3482 [Ancylostoma ceylanicum]|uniref:Uncharacterized protein n=1 Tax=Ancylostoma ceylanicum TaxID=53326 RepID=A0A016W6L9_9BILA|nr:hypothetical protein Y032_1044g3482 [Ancylostoma ceylanicum]